MKKFEYFKWWANQALFLVGAVILFVLGFWVVKDIYIREYASRVARLQYYISKDVLQLKHSNRWPKYIESIGNIKFDTQTTEFEGWVKRLRLPLEQKREGRYSLLVTLTAHGESETGSTGVLVHYKFLRVLDNELMWELVRVYSVTH